MSYERDGAIVKVHHSRPDRIGPNHDRAKDSESKAPIRKFREPTRYGVEPPIAACQLTDTRAGRGKDRQTRYVGFQVRPKHLEDAPNRLRVRRWVKEHNEHHYIHNRMHKYQHVENRPIRYLQAEQEGRPVAALGVTTERISLLRREQKVQSTKIERHHSGRATVSRYEVDEQGREVATKHIGKANRHTCYSRRRKVVGGPVLRVEAPTARCESQVPQAGRLWQDVSQQLGRHSALRRIHRDLREAEAIDHIPELTRAAFTKPKNAAHSVQKSEPQALEAGSLRAWGYRVTVELHGGTLARVQTCQMTGSARDVGISLSVRTLSSRSMTGRSNGGPKSSWACFHHFPSR